MSVASDPSTWPLWSAVIGRPSSVSAEQLGQPDHVRQCNVFARAKSRAAFARALIAAGVDRGRSEAAVSAWARDWANPSTGGRAAEVIRDDRVWLARLDYGSGERAFLVNQDGSWRQAAVTSR